MRLTRWVLVAIALAGCTAIPGAGAPGSSIHPTASVAPTASAGSTESPSPTPTTSPSEPRAPIASDAATVEERYRDALPLFEYDASTPLDVAVGVSPLEESEFGALHAISYKGPGGDRVTGLLGVPDGDGPFPAVIVMHGMPGRAADLTELIADYPAAGVVALGIDAPYARAGRQREPADTLAHPDETRDDQIGLVKELRRAVDVLEARDDVDDARIGYQGFSYGGAVGALVAGVEPRIAAFVLAVADGGLVEHLHDPADYGRSLGAADASTRDAWIAALEPIEPIYFVGKAGAPILFQSARGDELIPVEAAERLHAAAPKGSEVRWYGSGHFLPPYAFCEASAWLDEHLEFEGVLEGCD